VFSTLESESKASDKKYSPHYDKFRTDLEKFGGDVSDAIRQSELKADHRGLRIALEAFYFRLKGSKDVSINN
jgi:hypothetical protein